MKGLPEKIFTDKNGAIVEVARGNAGAALVNVTDKAQKVKIGTTLPDGQYTDAVHNTTFKVKKGILEGKAAPLTSYLLTAE